MKKLYFLMVLFLFISRPTFAQISINNDGTQPDGSAMLEVKSDHSGLLPPRMTHSAMNGISSPANGLVVYCSDCPGLYIYLNGTWNKVRLDCDIPAPTAGTQVPSSTQIIWNWNTVTGATGYKWNTVNDYSGGTNMGIATTKTETGLACNTSFTRYVWSYNDCGYSQVTPLTQTTSSPCIGLPILSTYAVDQIEQTTARSGGNITADGGAPVTERGICWSTTINPSITNYHQADILGGNGGYYCNLYGLQANTPYHVRAYATNSAGTAYGNDVTFTTLSFTLGHTFGGGLIFYLDLSGQSGLISADQDQSTGAQWGCSGTDIPGCYGTAIGTGQSNTNAIVNGCNDAGIAAKLCNDLERNGYDDWFLPSIDELNKMYLNLKQAIPSLGGFANDYYWSSSENNMDNAWTQNFTSNNGSQTDLAKTHTYHVRAVRAFSTTATLPTVTTTAITAITQNTATSGGNVTTDGGSPVTARGVCWGTSSNPDINGNHTTDAGGTFVSNLTGMTAKTAYYARAYATNSFGTSYGDQVSFTTLTFAIGQPYQGGKIFYLDGTGQHGLIAAIEDQSTNMRWYAGTSINTVAYGYGVGAGKINTALIIASQGYGDGELYAARVCNEYLVTVGGVTYGDWYLPSLFELHLMYQQKDLIENFSDGFYWSTNEDINVNRAWGQIFSNGTSGVEQKYGTYHVRAIRAF